MDPATLSLLGGLTKNIFGLFDTGAQDLAAAKLAFAQRSARDQKELATAPRTDALGNTVRYTPGQGFVTEVIPIVKAILDAQTREQLTSLREDAPRQRAAAVRKDERSKGANDLYTEAFKRVRDERVVPESEFKANAVLDAVRSREDNPVSSAAITSALRTGNMGDLTRIVKAGESTKNPLASAIAKAKMGGTDRYINETGARNNLNNANLGALASLAGDTDRVGIPFDNTNQQLSSQQGQMMQQLISAIAGGNSQVLDAMSNPALAKGNDFDFGLIFDLIANQQNDPLAEAIAKDVATKRPYASLYNDF